MVESRSAAAGAQLAAALLERRQGLRPVTLVGYSLGARVVKHAVAALDAEPEGRGRGLIQDVVLVGAPLDTSEETWAPLRRVAAGRVVNCCMASTGDWMLQFVYRTNTMAGEGLLLYKCKCCICTPSYPYEGLPIVYPATYPYTMGTPITTPRNIVLHTDTFCHG